MHTSEQGSTTLGSGSSAVFSIISSSCLFVSAVSEGSDQDSDRPAVAVVLAPGHVQLDVALGAGQLMQPVAFKAEPGIPQAGPGALSGLHVFPAQLVGSGRAVPEIPRDTDQRAETIEHKGTDLLRRSAIQVLDFGAVEATAIEVYGFLRRPGDDRRGNQLPPDSQPKPRQEIRRDRVGYRHRTHAPFQAAVADCA